MNELFSIIQFIVSVIGPVILMTAPADSDPPAPSDPDPPPTDPGDDGGGSGGGGSPTCSTGSSNWVSTDISAKTVTRKMYASFSGNTDGDNIRRRIQYYLDAVAQTESTLGTTTVTSSSYNSTSNGQSNKTFVADDNTWSWRGRCRNLTDNDEINGSTKYFKSEAIPTTASDPTVTTIGATSVGLNCDFFPNTLHSTATCALEYKLTSETTVWTQAGDTADTSGYAEVTMIRGVTGLTAETSYDVRLVITRNTTDETSFTSATVSFSTIADIASITTDAATGIGFTGVTFNATVDHNTEDGALSWRYDTSNPSPANDTSGTEVAYGSNPITADGSFSVGSGTLSASTAYFFWAIYEPTVSGTKVFGSVLSFTTTADPGTEASAGEMLPIQDFDRKWGVATTLFFVVPSEAGTSSDLFFDGAAPWASGESKVTGVIYDDDSTPTVTGEANTASVPTREGSTPIYRLNLSTSEMAHDELFITITDAGAAVRDVMLRVRTHQMMSTIDLDASAKATNTTAFTLTGNGTGSGAKYVGGDNDGAPIVGFSGNYTQNFGTLAAYNSTTSVDLDNSTAIATNDTYNGAIILFTGGTGLGQARVITDYVGSTFAATLNTPVATALSTDTTYIIVPGSDWNRISPGVELAALPTKTSSYASLLQFLFQRFVYKRTQTATEFKMKEDDGSTDFASNAVDDDGSVQTHNEMGDL